MRRSLLFLAAGLMLSTTTAAPAASSSFNGHGLGYLGHRHEMTGVLHWAPKIRAALPPSLDLRSQGWVSTIKNQGMCGSCWAFSITKTLESALLRAKRGPLDLAEQQMVSCDRQAYGCGGGSMEDMDYVVRTGLATEADYPYTGSSSSCKPQMPRIAAKAVRWGFVGAQGRQPTPDEIKQALNDYGVLSTIVAAGGMDWQRGGVMTGCNNTGQNHMVNLVGYRPDGLFIGANSWGTGWGTQGFFAAAQGCDQLATGPDSVSFLVVDGGPIPTPPHVRLPSEIDILPGTENVPVGVMAESGVIYSWFKDGMTLPQHDSLIYVTTTQDSIYKVVATTAAGTAESSVKIHVLPASAHHG